MKLFALVILTHKIKVLEFEHKDDFVTARQTLATKGTRFIPLKFHVGAQTWLQPEVCE